MKAAIRFWLVMVSIVLGALALGVGGLQAQSDSSSLDALVAQAKEQGVEVIVINPDGSARAADAATDSSGSSILMTTQERLAAFRTTLRQRLRVAPASLEELIFILNGQSPSGHWSEYLRIVFWTVFLLAASEIIVRETFGKRFVGPWFIGLQREHPIGYYDKLPVLLLRMILAMTGLALVVVLSYFLGYLVFGEAEDGTVRLTVAFLYVTYVTARAVVFLWRMILSPYLSPYRIPYFTDSDALRLYWWLLSVASISIVVINFCSWIEELGVSYNVHAVITSVLTFAVVLLNVAMVLANRRAISDSILGGNAEENVAVPTRIAARIWAPSVIIYFFVAWAEMTYRLIEALPLGWPLISGFYMIFLAVIVTYGMIGYVIERIFRRRHMMEELQSRLAARRGEDLPERSVIPDLTTRIVPAVGDDLESQLLHTHKIRTFEDLSRRVANILAIVVGAWSISYIWQIDIGMAGLTETSNFYDIVVILFLGYISYHSARIWIDQKIEEEGGDQVEVAPGDEGGAGGASRLATLLPLFRNFLLVLIFVSVAMIALTNAGINVSALFAGAGVIGLAIGFGAQTLVRDIFSGAFFLFDDAFRKGEYIDIGEVKGTVEKISVRSFQLRHHLGPLHTVPFGEIQHLTNYSRDWVMMKLPLRVTYDTDVEQVRKLVKKLGQQLVEDPVIGHQFLQPLKSQGVIEMQDSAMIIRIKFMTKPGDQWVLRKRVYQEIRDLFEREGIKFAHREVTVRLAGEGADALTPEQKRAVGAAALSSMDGDDMAEALEDMSDDR
ncbi:MAG: mechanosensitive ion channel family protein [Pseudomonadota bacterium]